MHVARPVTNAWQLPLVIFRHRELLGAFVRRELRARIEGSVLGRVWPILQPLILFIIYYVIFSKILKIGFSDRMPPQGPEGVGWRTTFYLITGILPWTVLADSLGRGTGVVLENANLIKKIAFPSELLPLYQVIVYHVYFLIGFVILLGLELAVNTSLPLELMWFPVVVVVQIVFITALTLFLSAANVFVRDVMQAVPVVLTFWMFTTPVFYDLYKIKEGILAPYLAPAGIDPATLPDTFLFEPTPAEIVSRLPAEAVDKLSDIEFGIAAMEFNPMAWLLELYRAIFSYGLQPFPVAKLGQLALLGTVLLLVSYTFFLRCKGRFADEV